MPDEESDLKQALSEFVSAADKLAEPGLSVPGAAQAQRRFNAAGGGLAVSGLEELTKAAHEYLLAERAAGIRAEALNASMAESTKISAEATKISAEASKTSADAAASMALFTKVIAVLSGIAIAVQAYGIHVQAKTPPPIVNYTAPTINNVMPAIPPAQIIVQQPPLPSSPSHRAKPSAPR